MTNLEKLIASLPEGSYKLDEPMASHTTVGIGGPADIWYVARTSDDLVRVVRLARRHKVQVTILGWGSNVLVGDKGIRGLVIHNANGEVRINTSPTAVVGPPSPSLGEGKFEDIIPRWQADRKKGTFKYEFSDLNYEENDATRVEVVVDSGVSLPFLINYLIYHGVTGLQWFAGIPGTVGGAVFNNIHGGTRFFHEVIKKVKVLTKDNKLIWLTNVEMELDYDKSRFHASGDLIVEIILELFAGDKERAKMTAEEWARRKKIQPRNTPGCVFKNISNEDKERLGYPTTATGYIIEHVLKMGGFRIGDAVVSTAHHNFIVNAGKATAKDYLAVMKEIQKLAKDEIGIELEPEIFLLGEF